MRRRHFIRLLASGLCAGPWICAHAHTPYNQWRVYRRKHLLIGCHKDSPETYTLAKKFTAILKDELPQAKARVARAPTAQRLASLLGTDQLDVALLSHQNAVAMAAGTESYEPYGQIALKALHVTEEYTLVVREDIPVRHVWLVAQALNHATQSKEFNTAQPPLPWHVGASLYRSGEPLPVE